MSQARQIEDALRAVESAFKVTKRTSRDDVPDETLVSAGLQLCGALRGLGDSFWVAIQANPASDSIALHILDDPGHAQAHLLPLLTRLLLSLGYQPPEDACEIVDEALLAYTVARNAAGDTALARVRDARSHVEALTNRICSLSHRAYERLQAKGALDNSSRARLKKLIKSAAAALTLLLAINGAMADTAANAGWIKDNSVVHHAVENVRNDLSDAGKDALRILGLHEVSRQSEDQQYLESSDNDELEAG